MSMCKNCGAAIEWLTTASGSLIPVDEEPVFLMEGRRTERFLTDEGEVLIGRPAKPGEESAKMPIANGLAPTLPDSGVNPLQSINPAKSRAAFHYEEQPCFL